MASSPSDPSYATAGSISPAPAIVPVDKKTNNSPINRAAPKPKAVINSPNPPGKLPINPRKKTSAANKSIMLTSTKGAANKLDSFAPLNLKASVRPGFSLRANSKAAHRQIAPPKTQMTMVTMMK